MVPPPKIPAISGAKGSAATVFDRADSISSTYEKIDIPYYSSDYYRVQHNELVLRLLGIAEINIAGCF